MRPCLLLLATLVALAVATGCGERAEPLGELEQPYPVTVQGVGDQPTVLRDRPERIVALDPGSAELLIALGARDRLVGVPADMERGDGPRQAPPEAAEVVSRTLRVRVDDIAELEPDLIVATPSTDQLDLARAQRETGAAVYVQPSASVDDILRATSELGFVVGEPVEARAVASRIRSEVAAVEERIADSPVRTTFVDTGFFVTVPLRSLLGDLVVRARGESVAGETPGAEPIPINRLRRLDPEVYLATSDSGVTLRTLRRDPRTARLTAVEEGRVRVLPSDLVQRAGPFVAQSLERVARALHPDVFRTER
ncbi:MAG TPA: ABC transporter substrate-binding protein [Gaiellaceae bacterium]|nr:ABC transporter substrate-binding protein [Gaiellaceae bacterium]